MSESPAQQHRLPRVVRAMSEAPWEILRSTLDTLMEIVATRDAGVQLTADEIQARIGSGPAQGVAAVNGTIAVLPLRGVLMPRASLMLQSSGVVSVEDWANEFSRLVDDPNVGSILIDCHSPGGSVYLISETATKIRAARGTKPIVAIANTLCCSAAYHLASQADEVVASPSSLVGSIGAYMLHEDWSKFWDGVGIDPTYIFAGKYKTEGNPDEPLGEEAREHFQEIVDDIYTQFVNDVAKGRGVRVSEVRNGYGQGRVVGSRLAVELGLVDRVETREATMARLAKGSVPATKARAEAATVAVSDGEIHDAVAQEKPDASPDADEESAAEAIASLREFAADTRADIDSGPVLDELRAIAQDMRKPHQEATR